jgi:hypothetical protein
LIAEDKCAVMTLCSPVAPNPDIFYVSLESKDPA